MTDTSTDNACRAAFEKWAPTHFHGNHWNLDRCHKKDSIIYGKYLWVHVEDAWVQWQAAIIWYQADLVARLEAEMSHHNSANNANAIHNSAIKTAIAIVRGGE